VLRERGRAGYARFKSRLRLSSADRFGDHTTKTEPPFPLWVDTFRPEIKGRRWYHRFSAITARAGGFDVERHVRRGHGPLGALYPTNTTHPQKEGDSMTFLYLVPTGMNDPERPGGGSWAGRYGPNERFPGWRYFHANQVDTRQGTASRENTLARWAVDLQNDFRARLDWCVKPPREANHPPRVRLAGSARREAAPGETVILDASGSTDPDGQSLRYEWFVYAEAGTCREAVGIEGAEQSRATLTVPASARDCEIHVIAAVRDAGEPPLARYTRVVLRVSDRR
jgi:hypothetical protein